MGRTPLEDHRWPTALVVRPAVNSTPVFELALVLERKHRASTMSGELLCCLSDVLKFRKCMVLRERLTLKPYV